MGEASILDGQAELFAFRHQRPTIPRCGDCGRFLRTGTPCTNPRCYGDGAYSHIPANAIMAGALTLPGTGAESLQLAADVLAAAWPAIMSTINPPKG